jgi:hypothetical protein
VRIYCPLREPIEPVIELKVLRSRKTLQAISVDADWGARRAAHLQVILLDILHDIATGLVIGTAGPANGLLHAGSSKKAYDIHSDAPLAGCSHCAA